MKVLKLSFFIFIFLVFGDSSYAQDLEPRAITNLPIGTNFLLGSYAYTSGNILLDPSLPIDGLDARLNSFVFAYVRSINFFGQSAKIDAVLPYVFGDWNGEVVGLPDRFSQDGFGDLRVRLSFNFLNSPAMSITEFSNYTADVISGFSIQVIVPTGKYNSNELVNLGSNRLAFKPQWGFAKTLNKWNIETYASIWLFTNNTNYLNGNKLGQKPLYTVKFHLIRDLPENMWISANIGYGIGGRVIVNNVERDSKISAMRFGLHYAIPINRHALKIGYVSGIRFERGSDFDALTLTYQYRWHTSAKQLTN
ncbi:transporter [Cognatitamlana onchidii]|uniref:transporter n=1 Tax=Cognatitamlana onchidii TaxID=2562860 RepID=UPI0010A5EC7F|nr:transporter [Algibacter onchidii]